MTKWLIASAAVLLLSTAGASAGPATSNATTWIQLNNTCEYFGITRNGDVFAEVHGCGDLTLGVGAGMAVKTKEFGTSVVFGDSHRTAEISQSCYVVQRPFVTGGRWEAYFTTDGKNMVQMSGGTYTVVNGPPWK